jgi:hypothetical protein
MAYVIVHDTGNYWLIDDVVTDAPPPVPRAQLYNATINAYDYAQSQDVSVSISMDGSSTGFTTPHTFTGLLGSHTFTVPSTDSQSNYFNQWNTGQTSETIIVPSNGTYTADYNSSYPVTIQAYAASGWSDNVGITKDGSPTDFNTPHTFTSLTGTHTFAVPYIDPSGAPFANWNTGSTSTTITVTAGGTYTAYYQAPASVGGNVVPVDKFALLALLVAPYVPYVGLASTAMVAVTVATAIYFRRVKRRQEKQ